MDYVECPGTSDSIKLSLFLAGGISGCRNWQQNIISKLSPLDIILYNPRKKDYDHKNPDIAQEQIEGASNREMMLKMLKSDVTSDYIRLERNMVQLVVSIMEYPKIEPQTELLYLSEMLKLGSAIDFNKINSIRSEIKGKHKPF